MSGSERGPEREPPGEPGLGRIDREGRSGARPIVRSAAERAQCAQERTAAQRGHPTDRWPPATSDRRTTRLPARHAGRQACRQPARACRRGSIRAGPRLLDGWSGHLDRLTAAAGPLTVVADPLQRAASGHRRLLAAATAPRRGRIGRGGPRRAAAALRPEDHGDHCQQHDDPPNDVHPNPPRTTLAPRRKAGKAKPSRAPRAGQSCGDVAPRHEDMPEPSEPAGVRTHGRVARPRRAQASTSWSTRPWTSESRKSRPPNR